MISPFDYCFWISPVTGKIGSWDVFPDLAAGYTIEGDRKNITNPSPGMIDLKLDIIDLRRNIGFFERLDHHKIWIGNEFNKPAAKLNIDVMNLPILTKAVFPVPPLLPAGIPIPNPTFDPTLKLDWLMSGPWLPQTFATGYDIAGNPTGTVSSSALAMTQVRTSQIMKRFDNANFIVGSSTVSFAWENPSMALIPDDVSQFYSLGTTYTFTKAQSLGDLETGLLKNTVSEGKGTLSKAVSGDDYVNTANIPTGNLVIIDPLYPLLPGRKLIAPTDFSIRGNEEEEFEYPIADTIKILTGIACKFEKFAVSSIENNALVKSNNGELIKADPGTDYVKPSDIEDILSVVSATASVVKNIIGVSQSLSIKDVTGTQATALTTAVKNAVGLAKAAEITELTAEAADILTNKAALLEMEAQIAALAGVQSLTILGTILGFLGVTASGKAYGDYIRGQSLNVKNTYQSADLNDEGHNAVGDFEFRYPSGYSSDNRGFSTLWFDSHNRSNLDKSSAGLRLFAWDSGGDHMGYDSPLAPLHIGIFGYQNKYHIAPIPNPTPVYKGFVFECDFHNEDSGDDYYRFPKIFGLYDVKRTISTLFNQSWGWDRKDAIFEYNYSNFSFYKKTEFLEKARFTRTLEIDNLNDEPQTSDNQANILYFQLVNTN